jgi:hypothetical protein
MSVSPLRQVLLAAAAVGLMAAPAMAASKQSTHRHVAAGVSYAPYTHHGVRHSGSQRLVSDGPGTGFGFNHSPLPYRVGAWNHRMRQAEATHEAVDIDAATSGGYYGFPGDSVYGAGRRAAYGVFNGADGYGSPYFAGWYGPADGTDYGPFGHAYDD